MKNCGSATVKQLSNRRKRKESIRNVNWSYHATVKPHWTIVPLMLCFPTILGLWYPTENKYDLRHSVANL